jgi:hypothetical protein
MAENERTFADILATLTSEQAFFVAKRIDSHSDAEACKKAKIVPLRAAQWENRADVDKAVELARKEPLMIAVSVATAILKRGAADAAHALVDDVSAGKRHGMVRQAAAKDLLTRIGVMAPTKIAPTTPDGENEYRGLPDGQLNREIAAAIAALVAGDAGGTEISLDDARAAGATDTAG